VKSCKASNMEVTLLKGPAASGKNSKEVEKEAEKVIQLTDNIELSVSCIKKLDLDVIIYTEMHSSPTPYCLAHNRIAPLQIVLPGNEITTGLNTIDYYVSGKYVEADNSERLYTEKLIKLNGFLGGLDSATPVDNKYSKAYFGIPEGIKIINVMHQYLKFHPDWDAVLEKIAQKSGNTLFLLTTKKSHNEYKLIKRLEKTAPTMLAKSMFINHLPKDKFLGVMNCSDVMLDPFYKGCGTTAFDALELGLPIITWPGIQSRSRNVYGLYKIMGIDNPPIAKSATEYIDLCIETISMKEETKARLKNHIKHNYKKVVQSHEKAISELVELINDLISTRSAIKQVEINQITSRKIVRAKYLE